MDTSGDSRYTRPQCGFPLFLLALFVIPASTQTAGLDAGRLKLIRTRLDALVDSQAIPGAVALVARHGHVEGLLKQPAGATSKARKPMKTNSIFQIMSMTKTFTGVGIMMLVEQGKIELRRPVPDYLPEFGQEIEETMPNGHGPAPAGEPSHSLGADVPYLRPPGDPDGALTDNPRTMRVTLEQAVRYYAHKPLKFEPGTHGVTAMKGSRRWGGSLKWSGDDYVHFIQTRILNPLGMKDTFFFPPENMKDRIAMVYRHRDGKLVLPGTRSWPAIRQISGRRQVSGA